MATDYLDRLYWPKRSSSAAPENRTTYGRTIAMSAKLGAVESRNPVDWNARHRTFLEMVRKQNEQEEQMRSIYYEPAQSVHYPPVSTSGAFKSGRGLFPNVTDQPLDVSLFHGPSSDPFVPNNSYKQHVQKQRRAAASAYGGQSRRDDDEYSSIIPAPHRLYRSAGGYDDSVKSYNHIHTYRPDLQDLSEYKVRQGRNGGVWKHVKEVMQGKGQRIVFIDGQISVDNLMRIRTKLQDRGMTTPPSRPQTSNRKYTTYIEKEEQKAAEGVNYKVMR